MGNDGGGSRRRGGQTERLAFAEEFNERGAFCGVEDVCEPHLRGFVVNVVERVRNVGGRRELRVLAFQE